VVDVGVDVLVDAVAVGVLADELVLEELPQPARTTRLPATASAVDVERQPARSSALWNLT